MYNMKIYLTHMMRQQFFFKPWLNTHPLIMSVSSVRYTFRCVRATVSLNLWGRSSLSSPLRLGEWYKDTLTESPKFWISGRSMVLELCSPRDPLVCSRRISTFSERSEAVDLFTASLMHSTYQNKEIFTNIIGNRQSNNKLKTSFDVTHTLCQEMCRHPSTRYSYGMLWHERGEQ